MICSCDNMIWPTGNWLCGTNVDQIVRAPALGSCTGEQEKVERASPLIWSDGHAQDWANMPLELIDPVHLRVAVHLQQRSRHVA